MRSKEEIKGAIRELIKQEYPSYVEFWVNLFPRDPLKSREDPVSTKGAKIRYMSEGIYDNLCEIDFRKFSFSNIKFIAEREGYNGQLQNVISVLSELIGEYVPEHHNLKRLRIYFFECLDNCDCDLYNPSLYRECLKRMLDNMDKAEEIIISHSKPVIHKLYDSFSFLAEKGDGEQITREINERLESNSLSFRFFVRVVSFRNLNYYLDDTGDKFIKRTTWTGEIQERVKEEVIKYLMDLNYSSARVAIKEANIRGSLRKSYLKSIDKIEKESTTPIKPSDEACAYTQGIGG